MSIPILRKDARCDGTTNGPAAGRTRQSKLLAAVIAVAALAFALSGCGGANGSGTWEGEMVGEDDEILQLTRDLEQAGNEISGDGIVQSESGDSGPIEISGGEVDGSDVTIEFEDAFGGQRVQGELNGELSGQTISGEGQVYSANSTGQIDDTSTFELQREEG